jgi:hypothetical protein
MFDLCLVTGLGRVDLTEEVGWTDAVFLFLTLFAYGIVKALYFEIAFHSCLLASGI